LTLSRRTDAEVARALADLGPDRLAAVLALTVRAIDADARELVLRAVVKLPELAALLTRAVVARAFPAPPERR
jgi:hypothetical protein